MQPLGIILTLVGLVGSVSCSLAISVNELYGVSLFHPFIVGMCGWYFVGYSGTLLLVYSWHKQCRR